LCEKKLYGQSECSGKILKIPSTTTQKTSELVVTDFTHDEMRKRLQLLTAGITSAWRHIAIRTWLVAGLLACTF